MFLPILREPMTCGLVDIHADGGPDDEPSVNFGVIGSGRAFGRLRPDEARRVGQALIEAADAAEIV